MFRTLRDTMMIARDTAPIRKRKNHFWTIFLISDRMRSPAVCRLLMVLLCALLTGSGQAQNRYVHLLAGTYTSGASEGIYVYRFDTQTGKRSEEHTSELQSLMRISYAVFCLKKKKNKNKRTNNRQQKYTTQK